MSQITGLEILFSTIKMDLKSKEDCVVAAIHCILLNSDLLCVGVGEEFSDDNADTATEHLPENWNINQDVYCLRYRYKDMKSCCLLKISKAGCHLHIDFGTNEDMMATTTVNTNEFVSDDFINFSKAFKKLNELKNHIQKSILSTVVEFINKTSSPPKERNSKKEASPNQQSPIDEKSQSVPIGVPDSKQTGSAPVSHPEIGTSDLDPLGRGQGSMLYDPFSRPSSSSSGGSGLGPHGGGSGNTGLPTGAVPPGARFDPIYPVKFDPDPDVFKPPDDNSGARPDARFDQLSSITPLRVIESDLVRSPSNNDDVHPDARFDQLSPLRANSDPVRSPDNNNHGMPPNARDDTPSVTPFGFDSNPDSFRPPDTKYGSR